VRDRGSNAIANHNPKVAANGKIKGKAKKEKGRSGARPPLGKILEGVRFGLSGFKNPYRDKLRRKAIELGAFYDPEWNSRSTHLLCAFAHTPKYKEVEGSFHRSHPSACFQDVFVFRSKFLPFVMHSATRSMVRGHVLCGTCTMVFCL
jgi:hypothetical protein